MASTTSASSSMDTLPNNDAQSPSTLFTLVVVIVLGLVWLVVVVGLGFALAAALQWILTN